MITKSTVAVPLPSEVAAEVQAARDSGELDYFCGPICDLGQHLYMRRISILVRNQEVWTFSVKWYAHVPWVVKATCTLLRRPLPIGDPRPFRGAPLERAERMPAVVWFLLMMSALGVVAGLLAAWWMTR